MMGLGRWKTGLAMVLLLHFLVHPAIHVHRSILQNPELSRCLQSSFESVDSSRDDVCSLCRLANSLQMHIPVKLYADLALEAAAAPTEQLRCEHLAARRSSPPRAPPVSV
jgi:hypothetical protein